MRTLAILSTVLLTTTVCGQQQCQKLEASDEDCLWQFGGSLDFSEIGGTAIDVDGPVAVIGAKGASLRGAVYVFQQQVEGHWAETQRILGPVGSANFGESVGLNGATMIVGAPGSNAGIGLAYIYELVSGSWSLAATLAETSVGRFGQAVDVYGNVAVVGAPSIVAGRAFAYTKPAVGVWSLTNELIASSPDVGDSFGEAVSIFGGNVFVGAPLDDDPLGMIKGSVYLFQNSGGFWLQSQRIFALPANSSGQFGSALDSDGTHLVVGAPAANGAIGAVEVITEGGGGIWGNSDHLVASNGVSPDLFGHDVALSGGRIVVGAFSVGPNNNAGAAYLFEGGGTSWSEVAVFASSDLVDGDRFGEAVAVQGDQVLVGAPGEGESGCIQQGAVYVFRVGDAETYCTAKANSLGCTPAICWTGTPGSMSPDPFTPTATNVLNNKPGLFFYGTNGRDAAPFLGGTLCIVPPIKRSTTIVSTGNPPPDDCSGIYQFDFQLWLAGGNDPNVTTGTTVNGQFWSRDTAQPDGTGVGLTNGIEFTW